MLSESEVGLGDPYPSLLSLLFFNLRRGGESGGRSDGGDEGGNGKLHVCNVNNLRL